MENNTTVKCYKIPQDVLMDILRILFGNHIKHHITEIKERENIVLLKAHFTPNAKKHHEAKENIESILEDYSKYMNGLLNDNILVLDKEEQN